MGLFCLILEPPLAIVGGRTTKNSVFEDYSSLSK
jgi:hypothetical protein